MKHHAFAMWGLFFITLFAFIISIGVGSMMTAFICLIVGLVLAFVLGISWTRFKGYPPEHHPPIDKIVDDTRP